jgi:hypothetical protein
MLNYLPYDPGLLPTRPAPAKGETLVIEIPGPPPIKTTNRSIRNQEHPQYPCFVTLRNAATSVMAGRAWYLGAVGLNVTIFGPRSLDRWNLNDYLGGIMDTLDGSSGRTFTYLPIVFEDDCQVRETQSKWLERSESSYRLEVMFK